MATRDTGRTPDAGGDWERYSPEYRRQWEGRHGSTGGRWEDFEPGYRYGHEMANDPRYRGREWHEVETDLGSGYDTWARGMSYDYERSPWNSLKDSVREAWEGARGAGRQRTETGVGPEYERREVGEDVERGGTVQLREEELLAQKRDVEAGAVNVRTDVVSEQRTLEVPVTREEVYVERRPVEGREVSDRPIGEGETIRVPVYEEEVTAEKRPVVREEITVGKQAVEETERVSGTVRREEARVERTGDVEVQGGTPRVPHEHRYTEGRCVDCGEPEAR